MVCAGIIIANQGKQRRPNNTRSLSLSPPSLISNPSPSLTTTHPLHTHVTATNSRPSLLHTSAAAPYLMRNTDRRGRTLYRFMFNMFPRKLFRKKTKYLRNMEIKYVKRKRMPLRKATNVNNLKRLIERQALALFYGTKRLRSECKEEEEIEDRPPQPASPSILLPFSNYS